MFTYVEDPEKTQAVGNGAGSLLLLALVMVVVGYLLAPHFYLTRSIFWGESDYINGILLPKRTRQAQEADCRSRLVMIFLFRV